jgi:hypothetical protein
MPFQHFPFVHHDGYQNGFRKAGRHRIPVPVSTTLRVGMG